MIAACREGQIEIRNLLYINKTIWTLSKMLQIQGAQILRNEAYMQYAAMTQGTVQHSPSDLLRAMSLSNGRCGIFESVKE